MKALVWHGGTALAVEELPDPAPADGQVVLDVALAGICGSDLHGYRGHPGPRVPPLVLGHEVVGTLAGTSERYVPFPIAFCGACPACARGEENLCERRGLLGLDRAGVFAERVAVPERSLVPVPAGVPDEVAVLTEPLAVCVSVLRQDRVEARTRLLVVGCGPIGLLTIYAAAALGARVTAVEPLPERRRLAEGLGVDAVVATGDELDGAAFDVAVDAVGVEPTAQLAIAAVRRGGTATLVGLSAAEARLPLAQLVRDGVTVRGHYAYTRADFEAALAMLAAEPPDLGWLTLLDLDDGAEGFRRLVDEPGAYAKVVLSVRGA